MTSYKKQERETALNGAAVISYAIRDTISQIDPEIRTENDEMLLHAAKNYLKWYNEWNSKARKGAIWLKD